MLKRQNYLATKILIGLFISNIFFFAIQLLGVPPDLTQGEAPTSNKTLNLGPTGLSGWLYHDGDDSSESRQILVKSVDTGSPAGNLMAINDVILGADGTGSEPENFSSDAMRSLAKAIADAEARNPATLKLLRWRAGETATVTLTLQHLGAYSPTAPYNCPKSAAILEQGLQYVEANQDAGRFSLGTLALLAGNDPSNPANAARQARARTEALALILDQENIDEMLGGKVPTFSKATWSRGYQLIVLAEYYLQTGDAQVFPSIEARAVEISNGQSAFGTMGHQFTNPSADGSLNGIYNVGYGAVNAAAMPCFLGLLLAKECGVNRPELQPAIDRGSRFFASYTGYGSIPYGEHKPGQVHASNGKSGLAAIAFSLQANRVKEGKFFAKMATASTTERMQGHTGPWFNYLWSPLGAATGGEKAEAAHFSRISWQLDLCRRWDGGFVYNTLLDGDSGKFAWHDSLYMYVPALLTYALPLRQLYITGHNHNPDRDLSDAEVAAANFADLYDATTRTTSELVADLGQWSPKVKKEAAKEIGQRTSDHATLLPQLIAIANNTNAGEQRIGACMALGKIKDGSAAVHLAALLTDNNMRVRYAAGEALRYLPQADRMAQLDTIMEATVSTSKPVYPIDENDPLHFAHHRLCMLLFYSGGSYGPSGVISGNKIEGIDREKLYPVIKAVANNPNGLGRSTLSQTYQNLTKADVEALGEVILNSIIYQAPCDKMFSGPVRIGGVKALEQYNISEGVPLCMMLNNKSSMKVLKLYEGSSLLVKPDPNVIDFCNYHLANSPGVRSDIAQEILDAIAADTNPVEPIPLKSIDSVSADIPSLTLPNKQTQLHVDATDKANGDSIYTWRMVEGPGQVTFTPNGTGTAKDTTVVVDGSIGEYIFEVKMSDSRALTEVVDTVTIVVESASTHSADTDKNWQISQNEVNSFISAYQNNNNTVDNYPNGSITPNRITMREVMRVIYLYNQGGGYITREGTVDNYDIAGAPAQALDTELITKGSGDKGDGNLVVSSTAGSGAGSLRNAIMMASDGNTITIDESVDTITVLSEIIIDKSITIDGQGAAIVSGENQTRIFRIQNDDRQIDVTLKNVGIVDAANETDEFGGAIYNNGQVLTLDTVLLDGNKNTTENGKGGAVYSSGTLNVINCEFRNNTASEDHDIHSDNDDVTITE